MGKRIWLRLLQFAALFTGNVVVAVQHFDHEVTYHMAYDDPFGMYCFINGHQTRLNEDGTVSGLSYVIRWKYAYGDIYGDDT